MTGDGIVLPGNPLAAGLGPPLRARPCTLVILGGGGDLARRKLLPALYNLGFDGELPGRFAAVGVARSELDDAGYRDMARAGIERHSRRPLDDEHFRSFASALHWLQGSFDDARTFVRLRERLASIEAAHGLPPDRVFYLAIPPRLIGPAVEALRSAGLLTTPSGSARFARVIVEKPIGESLASARAINATLARGVAEPDIYRIDHYLGKETVQNIMVMRFANAIFEPLFNHKYIDHVQITAAEEVGVGTRAGYYDRSGALRDMVQNHLLQLLSLTAMEPPYSLEADVVRDHKLEVLRCLRPIRGAEVERCVVRAQYDPGFARGADVVGYLDEDRVAAGSTTETFTALKVHVDTWRWAGVPFYLRTGKRLAKRATEIAVQFKMVPPVLFNADPERSLLPNVLALRIQPEEGLSLRIATKLPGAKVRIYPVRMDFRYGSTFGDQSPEAYERLLLDVMAGDATLFMRRDAVETSWAWIDPIRDRWDELGATELARYGAGTWGPDEADHLLEADGRAWRRL